MLFSWSQLVHVHLTGAFSGEREECLMLHQGVKASHWCQTPCPPLHYHPSLAKAGALIVWSVPYPLIRNWVVRTLKSALGLHEHTKKTKFQLGFYCPGRFQAAGHPHICGCLPRQNHMNPKSYVCSKSPRCQEQCRLPHKCTIWFEYWKVSCRLPCSRFCSTTKASFF